MAEDDALGTVTLARLFASQGHWEKAIRIYRQLLEREPDRQDIARELAETEEQLRTVGRRRPPDLENLFEKWLDLLLQRDRLLKLERLKSRF